MAKNQHNVDIDEIITNWATEKLGESFTLEKIDVSKIKIAQGSTTYQSNTDWWTKDVVHEEIFDNMEEALPITWNYTHKANYNSNITWKLLKNVKSTKYCPLKVVAQFPVAELGKDPLQVEFDSQFPEQATKSASRDSLWDVSTYVTVKPHFSSRATSVVRTCRLENVPFCAEVQFSGTIRVLGHKKRKTWTKQELTASLADALGDRPGFKLVENASNPKLPAKYAVLRVEGLCSGQVGIKADAVVQDVQTLV